MNHHDEALLERVGSELRRRADDVPPSHLGLTEVRGRAFAIRRRRRAGAALAVAAAVVAVLVPVGLLAGEDRQDLAPAPAPARTPGSAVLHDGVVTLADGRTVEVDLPADVMTLGVLSDGRFVATTNGRRAILVLGPDGRREAAFPAASATFTMGTGDRTVAWVDRTLRVQVLESGSPEPVAFPGVPMPGEAEGSIDAVLGSDCAEGGCRVLAGDYTTTTHELTLEDATELSLPEDFRVADVSPDEDTWAVTLRPAENQQHGCAGLYDVAAATVVARNCETSGLRFSPDGEHLLGARGDNNMLGQVDVVDRDLRPVLTHDPEGRDVVVSRTAWADAGHLAVSVVDFGSSEWTLLRVPVDGGDPTVVDGPAPGGNPEMVAEYVFGE